MPTTCWGKYGKVAVVEVDEAVLEKHNIPQPRMISPRAIGMVRIVKEWRRLNKGTTNRCAYHKAMQEAEKLIKELGE